MTTTTQPAQMDPEILSGPLGLIQDQLWEVLLQDIGFQNEVHRLAQEHNPDYDFNRPAKDDADQDKRNDMIIRAQYRVAAFLVAKVLGYLTYYR